VLRRRIEFYRLLFFRCASGGINDSKQGKGIGWVDKDFQIGKEVFDFPSAVEFNATDNLVWNFLADKNLFEDTLAELIR